MKKLPAYQFIQGNSPVDDRVAMLQTALEHMDEGFSLFSTDLKLLAWNERFFELLDLPHSLAHVGAPFEDFIRFNAERREFGDHDPEEFVRNRVNAALKFIPHCFERTRPNGIILEIRGNPIPGLGFVTIYTDVTARRRAERDLKDNLENMERRVRERTADLEASERWIRQVADAVPALIGSVDSEMVYRFANQAYKQWLGHEVQDVIGRPVAEVLRRPFYPGQAADLAEVRAGHKVVREFSATNPAGQQVEILVTYLPHMAENGQQLGYFILGQDLTERKQVESALHQAQKMEAVGQLTGGLAHDFNNLLTIIIGNLALINDTLDADGETVEMAGEALAAARHGADLVRRLLAFSRQRPLRLEVYDPKRVVLEMHPLLSRTLGDHIHLAFESTSRDWQIESDPSELENALLNLAINGRDAMPEGGRLVIRVEERTIAAGSPAPGIDLPAGDYILLSVQDSGCGMPPEVRERAFEPFFTSKAQGRGSGLGLSMVYGFAQRSGGMARIVSAVGQGTTIELYLPRRLPACRPPRQDKPTGRRLPGGRERVLLVEDESRVRGFVRRSLRHLGYSIAEAASGREALGLMADGGPFDLLLTDIEMPEGVSGLDLARKMNADHPETPILLMSGHPDRAMSGGEPWNPSWALLPKPFETADLARAVRRALDKETSSPS